MMPGPLSVNALIEKLTALTPEQRDLPVWSEGCDCSGEAFGIHVADEAVHITRATQTWNEETDEMVWEQA